MIRSSWICLLCVACGLIALPGCNKPPAADDESSSVVAADKQYPRTRVGENDTLNEGDQTVPGQTEQVAPPVPDTAAKATVDDASSESATDTIAAAEGDDTESVVTGDWPMWGGTPSRNMVCDAKGISLDFDLRANENVVWSMNLGTQSYGNPVVADGKVYVGTNNGAEYRPKHKGDRGLILCFNETNGELIWQLTREKLLSGQVQDWPEQGICSVPVVIGDRMWLVTNRCELMCVDTEGFHDGENDGPYTDEVDNEELDADIVWIVDMIEEMGVFPHNLATSSPVVVGDLVFIVTGNGVDEAHLELPNPRAPSFLAANIHTGEIAWEDNTPFDKVLHGQWSSPAAAVIDGKTQIVFPGGDGWLYSFNEMGELIWKCDLNPKDSKWELGGLGTRNNIIATPVFFENSVICGVGQDPEHGEGVGHLWRIDATKTGDVSPTLGEIGSEGTPNPNSAVIWHYGGIDVDGSVTGHEGELIFRRTLSTAAVADGLVYIADLSGFVHCIDWETGKRHWVHDLLSAVWGSPMVVDGKVFLGNEDGTLTVFAANEKSAEILAEFETVGYSSILSTPTFANGHLFLADRTRVYCIKVQ